ncbi:MAG: hypothetical protein M9899_08865 [Bdellovibrionaceae bacterium]|nr:hypothetical protein [Pseudobdellovibrionaceae bacterium]
MLTQIFSLKQESPSDLESILRSSLALKQQVAQKGWSSLALDQPYLVFQIFFEPSTRTRVSFETAAQRLGARHSYFQMDGFTSMSKGESIADSLKVFEMNHPDLLIIRSGEHIDVEQFYQNTSIPIICAGYGELYHPTQAFLDLVTIMEYKDTERVSGLKLLFVGDAKHSRVAHSHSVIAQKLGYELGQCADPAHWSGESHWQKFSNLDEAMDWADVVIRLRTQKERGALDVSKDYMITQKLLEKHDVPLMHPGPFLRNEDFEFGLAEHKNSLIWQQKENGHYVRAFLMKALLTKEKI